MGILLEVKESLRGPWFKKLALYGIELSFMEKLSPLSKSQLLVAVIILQGIKIKWLIIE